MTTCATDCGKCNLCARLKKCRIHDDDNKVQDALTRKATSGLFNHLGHLRGQWSQDREGLTAGARARAVIASLAARYVWQTAAAVPAAALPVMAPAAGAAAPAAAAGRAAAACCSAAGGPARKRVSPPAAESAVPTADWMLRECSSAVPVRPGERTLAAAAVYAVALTSASAAAVAPPQVAVAAAAGPTAETESRPAVAATAATAGKAVAAKMLWPGSRNQDQEAACPAARTAGCPARTCVCPASRINLACIQASENRQDNN